MNAATYIALLIPLLIVLTEKSRYQKTTMKNILKEKNKKENVQMLELAKKFVGRECYIYTINNTFRGVIKEVSDNAILLETKRTTDVVNLDFVLRISDVHKKGGKQSF